MPASYIPLRSRAKAVTVVFVVMVLVYAVAVWSSLLELQLMNRIIAGTQVTDAELASNDSRQLVIQALVFLLFAAGAIVFIGWLWAAYKNIDVVAPSERRYSESWAIFGWFVPILALVRPMKVVNDVWYAGSRDSVGAQPSAVILFWWCSWLLLWVLGVIARASEEATTPEAFRTGTIVSIVGDSVAIVAALLAIAVVRTLTNRLDEKAAAVPPAPPAPEGDFTAPERPAGVPA
jgi:hypothetical protein